MVSGFRRNDVEKAATVTIFFVYFVYFVVNYLNLHIFRGSSLKKDSSVY